MHENALMNMLYWKLGQTELFGLKAVRLLKNAKPADDNIMYLSTVTKSTLISILINIKIVIYLIAIAR